MRKTSLLFFAFAGSFIFSYSQKADSPIRIENHAAHEYRLRKSKPSYNLSKIEKMISKLKPVSENEDIDSGEVMTDYYLALSDKNFDKLQVKEKFTYTMIHPEYMSQVCADEMVIPNEEKQIFGYLPLTLDEANWSERQRNFLKSNQKEIVAFIKEFSLADKYIGINYKMALEEINAVEAIPFLIDFYQTKDKKDKDILTLLSLLVKNNRYYPYVRSNLYRDLYGNDESVYNSFIEYTPANEEYILKTAANFHAQYPKKKK